MPPHQAGRHTCRVESRGSQFSFQAILRSPVSPVPPTRSGTVPGAMAMAKGARRAAWLARSIAVSQCLRRGRTRKRKGLKCVHFAAKRAGLHGLASATLSKTASAGAEKAGPK